MQVYDYKTGKMVEKDMRDLVTAARAPTALSSGNTGLYGSTIEGADPTAIDDRRFDWNDLGAGAYAVLNEGLFGIPDWLVSLSGSENVKALKNWQQQNKMATDVGATIGGLGGLLIPGGTLTKGAGKALGLGAKALGTGSMVGGTLAKGAKAADLLGDVIRGGSKAADAAGSLGKLGKFANTGVGRGVLSAVEAGVPMAAADVLTGREDVGGALGNIAGGAALGGALGGVLGRAGKGPGKLKGGAERAVKNLSEDVTAKATQSMFGTNAQDLRRYFMQKYGRGRSTEMAAKVADDIMSEMVEAGAARGIKSPKMAEEFYDQAIGAYRQLADKMAEAEIDFMPSAEEFYNHPQIKAFIDQFQHGDEGKKLVDSVFREVSAAPNYGAAKHYINDTLAKKAFRATDSATIESSRIADAFNEMLDAPVERFAAQIGEDLPKMKADYKLAKFFEPAIGRDKFASLAKTGGGSPTFEKAALYNMLAGGGIGAMVPGEEGEDIGARLARIGMGAAAGTLANRVIPAVKNKLVGKGAELARKVVTPELASKIGGVAGEVAPRLESMAGAAGARGVRSATYDADAKAREAEANVTATEEATTPAAQEEAATAVNSTYAEVINEKLRTGYSMYFAQDMDYETFLAEIGRRTNNFDPKMMAGILFENPDERAQYLKSYDRAMQLKEVDLQRAMGGARSRPFWESASPEEAKAYDDLVNLISSVSGGGAIPSKSEKDAIRELVGNIMAQPVSDAEKRAMIEKMLSVQFGLPVDLYRKAGIYG